MLWKEGARLSYISALRVAHVWRGRWTDNEHCQIHPTLLFGFQSKQLHRNNRTQLQWVDDHWLSLRDARLPSHRALPKLLQGLSPTNSKLKQTNYSIRVWIRSPQSGSSCRKGRNHTQELHLLRSTDWKTIFIHQPQDLWLLERNYFQE